MNMRPPITDSQTSRGVCEAGEGETHRDLSLERNKAIMWARYILDSSDWLLYSSKVTRVANPVAANGTVIKLFSACVLNPEGKVVFEAMLKPSDEIPASLIADHGLEYSVVFNALPFSEFHQRLTRLVSGRQILSYDLLAEQHVFDELCEFYAQPDLIFEGHSLEREYSRFIGQEDAGGQFKRQALKVKGVGAAYRCRAILDALYNMAGSSQKNFNAAPGNQGWTSEFYRPKTNAKDKLKGFLGL